ncbi:hypothetical protein ONZ45_g1827 [Pleurotus djamor]|nr:hypothetical protein ONZ45_g1827 [Pleurotus djamor]
MTSFHPKPVGLPPVPPYQTRPIFPIYPPPPELTTPPPPLPSPPRTLPPYSQFSHISTHVVPAAYLRSTPYIPLPEYPQTEDKESRKKAGIAVRQTLGKIREETTSKRPDKGYEWVLWNCVNRYVPSNRKGGSGQGVTLFLVHANGFNKEIWETMLRHLLASSYQNIDEIWSFEAVQTGDAALINNGKLGAIYDWTDNGRDIANFLLHFMPPAGSSSNLPTYLPRVSTAETLQRQKNGFSQRKIVAVGHSFGGCTSTLAALTYPSLFSSLILVDPVIIKPHYYEDMKDTHIIDMAYGAIMRRASWKSRDEAKTLMLKSPFFAAWHPDVLDSYIKYGIHEHAPLPPPPSSSEPPTPSSTIVSLKMPPVQEGIAFLENITPYEVWYRLKDVDERISMHWIMPNPETTRFGPPVITQERVWRREKNASNVILTKARHLIPQEAPKECAEAIVDFLEKAHPSIPNSVDRARL